MKEKISRLSLGVIDTENIVIGITPLEIDETISYGQIFKDEVHIKSECQQPFRGFIYSSNPRVELSITSFAGYFAHIAYTVDTSRLDDGDVITGTFSLVTNAGEFVIPYSYTIKVGADLEGDFNSLEGFTKLVFANKQLAIESFVSPEFTNYPFMRDMKIRAIYDGLINGSNAEFALDEFLYATNMKSRDIVEKAKEFLSESSPEVDDAFEKEYLDAKSGILEPNNYRKLLVSFNRAKIDYLTKPYSKSSALLAMERSIDELLKIRPDDFDIQVMAQEVFYYKNYRDNPYKQKDYYQILKRARRCYESGCRTPYLYILVCEAYRNDITLLREFDEVTLAAFSFGSRHNLLNSEIASRIGDYARDSRFIEPIMFFTMKRAYKDYRSTELLAGICRYLLNNERRDTEAFNWYLEGSGKDLGLPRLFDYLLQSMPDDFNDILPKEVYAYFSYNSPIEERSMKLLYKNVVTHFSKASRVYLDLEKQIYNFVIEEMLAGNIDNLLAPIYGKFFTVDMVDDRIARILPGILLTFEAKVSNPDYKKIIIVYEEIEGEQSADIVDGRAIFPLYTNLYHIFAEDVNGNRHADNSLKVEKLVKGKKDVLFACESWDPTIPEFMIYNTHKLLDKASLTKEEAETLLEISSREGISSVFMTIIHETIIDAYNWRLYPQDAEMLLDISKDRFLREDILISIVEVLTDINILEEALKILSKVNYEKLSLDKLLVLCRYAIEKLDFELDEKILDEASYLFANDVYDGVTLRYLCQYFNGLSDDMKNILFRAIENGTNVSDMPERLLCQMIFANIREKLDLIFEIYAKSSMVKKNILIAYYVLKSYRYFIEGEEIKEELFEAVKNALAGELYNGTAPIILQLAVSKNMSEADYLSEGDENICREIINGLFAKGIVFPFFKKLTRFIDLPEEMLDKTIVTFFGKEDDSVALIIYSENDLVEPIYMDMNQVCSGIFTRSVLLYEGEYAGYEIRVTRNGESEIVDEGELKADVTRDGEDRKFIRLNELSSGSAVPDNEEWQKSMEKYALDDELNKLLFEI